VRRSPRVEERRRDVLMMAVLSITMFLGIAARAHVMPSDQKPSSRSWRGVFGSRGAACRRSGDMLIWCWRRIRRTPTSRGVDLARPLPAAAIDDQGDRLAFSNGIVRLSVFAALCSSCSAATHALIPLYDWRVRVVHAPRPAWSCAGELRTPHWQSHAVVNGIGAFVTGVVLLVVAATKAHEGAWIIILLIPINVLFFRATRQHYRVVAAQLSLKGWRPQNVRTNTVLVPISGIQRAVVGALDYAKTLSSDVRALYVNIDPLETERLKSQWDQWGEGVPLVVLDSPYRSLMEPLLEYVDRLNISNPGD
jgi:hypothetical protein